MSTYKILILAIIESFLVISTGLASIGIYVEKKRLLIATLINSITICLLRYWFIKNNFTLGLHTIIIIIFLILEIKFILKQNIINSIIAIFIGMFLILCGEGIFISLLMLYPNNLHIVSSTSLIFFIVSHILLIILFFITYVFKKPIIKFNNLK